MSGSEELDAGREARREALAEGQNDESDASDAADGAPAEPINVDGPAHPDDLVNRYDVALVDFYADWWGPCEMLEPAVAEVAAGTDAAVAKVDVDANQELAATYGVRGVPTLIVFSGSEPVQQVVGVRGTEQFVGMASAAAN
jgi:thioredoxin 1